MVVLEGRNERERKYTAKQDRPLIFSLSLSLSLMQNKKSDDGLGSTGDRSTYFFIIYYILVYFKKELK